MRLLEAVVVLLQCSQEVEAVVLLAGGGADPPLALPIHVVTRLGHQGAAHKGEDYSWILAIRASNEDQHEGS